MSIGLAHVHFKSENFDEKALHTSKMSLTRMLHSSSAVLKAFVLNKKLLSLVFLRRDGCAGLKGKLRKTSMSLVR